jgi:hypothetical protein
MQMIVIIQVQTAVMLIIRSNVSVSWRIAGVDACEALWVNNWAGNFVSSIVELWVEKSLQVSEENSRRRWALMLPKWWTFRSMRSGRLFNLCVRLCNSSADGANLEFVFESLEICTRVSLTGRGWWPHFLHLIVDLLVGTTCRYISGRKTEDILRTSYIWVSRLDTDSSCLWLIVQVIASPGTRSWAASPFEI